MVPLISNIGYGLLGAASFHGSGGKLPSEERGCLTQNIPTVAVGLTHRSSKF